VSVADDGTQGNNISFASDITSDGRFVAFTSPASNLVPNDRNGQDDVFMRDTCVGAAAGCTPSTIRVSVASDGTEANFYSSGGPISADGRFVAFFSAASNIVPDDTNSEPDVFVRDTCVGAPSGCVPSTRRVSVADNGAQAYNLSSLNSMTADGHWVVFSSLATNLVANDSNGRWDVFIALTGF
jgi:Tol biopolymer transport system component